MLESARQRSPAENPDWVPVDVAAEIAGGALRTWRWRAKREARSADAEGRAPLAVLAAPQHGKGRRAWWVHRSLHPKLTRYPNRSKREDRARAALCAKYPLHHVEAAYRKAYWLRKWRTLCEANRDASVTEQALAERIVRDAKIVVGEAFRIGYSTLRNWRRAYETLGPNGEIRGVEGLIHGCTGLGEGEASRSPEAIAHFHSLYHTENKLGVAVCHETTLREARRLGWTWPESYAATTRWLRENDEVSVSFLLRHGRDAWCRRYLPHLEIDYTLIEPGQMFQTDHHLCDWWVEHDGSHLRPWLCVVQDLRSRAIVGWHLTAKPHQDGIIAAYLMAFRDWAVPERLRIDNGKDFASELLCGVTKATRDKLRRLHGPDWPEVLRRDANLIECVDARFLGITAELGIQLNYAIPYAPWSKGVTERWFGLFEERCGKTFATYCGNAPDNRPECLDAIRQAGDVPTMDEAREAIGEFLTEFHARPHDADDMAGKTPLEVWNTASRLRRADDDALLFLMQSRGCYKVGKNGVAFKVGGVRFTYGAGNPALYRYAGRDVFITVDPNSLDYCFAFTADRKRFVGRLEANERISPMASVDDVRAANAKVGKQRKIMHQAGRSSPNRTRAVTEELRAKRRERVEKLRATGTEGKTTDTSLIPVRTGFEGTTEQVRKAATKPERRTRAWSLAETANVLGSGKGLSKPKRRARRFPDSVLAVGLPRATASTATDDGDEDSGTEAGDLTTDVFRLIGREHRQDERTRQ